MCGHFHADHLCEQPPMMRIKNVSKKSGLQAKMIIHLQKRRGRWKLSEIVFFHLWGIQTIQVLEWRIKTAPSFAWANSLHKGIFPCWCNNFYSKESGSQNLHSFKVVEPAQLNKIWCYYVHWSIWIISLSDIWGTKSPKQPMPPPKKARHNYKNADEGAVVLTHWVASCSKASRRSRRFSRFVENQVDHWLIPRDFGKCL